MECFILFYFITYTWSVGRLKILRKKRETNSLNLILFNVTLKSYMGQGRKTQGVDSRLSRVTSFDEGPSQIHRKLGHVASFP